MVQTPKNRLFTSDVNLKSETKARTRLVEFHGAGPLLSVRAHSVGKVACVTDILQKSVTAVIKTTLLFCTAF